METLKIILENRTALIIFRAVGLFGIKALKESPQQFDFYAEEDRVDEELEELGLE